MAKLSDNIEAYLIALFRGPGAAAVEVQRAEVARDVGCAPSQVTYVLATRFTPERGYVVESRRGGGGYVRITRLVSRGGLLRDILKQTQNGLEQDQARDYIAWLRREGLVSAREAALLMAAMDRDNLPLAWPEQHIVRARLLRGMMVALMKSDRAADG